MTSPLPLQSIQQDCETHHSDSAECTAVCLSSSFDVNGLGSLQEETRWGDQFFVNGFLIGIAFTCPPNTQVDSYTARSSERSKLNNAGKKEVGQVALAAEALEGSSSPAARLAV